MEYVTPVADVQLVAVPTIVSAAVGTVVTIIVDVLVEFPPGPVVTNVMVFVPAVDQDTECGPAVLAVAMEAPDPKFHA